MASVAWELGGARRGREIEREREREKRETTDERPASTGGLFMGLLVGVVARLCCV